MDLASYRNIVVLTGAGISQAAGLPTYRSAGGLWSDPGLARLSDVRRSPPAASGVRHVLEVPPRDLGVGRPRRTARWRRSSARATAGFDHHPERRRTAPARRLAPRLQYHGTLARWHCETCGVSSSRPMATSRPLQPADAPLRRAVWRLIPPEAGSPPSGHCGYDLFVAIGTSGTGGRRPASCAASSTAPHPAQPRDRRRGPRLLRRVPRRHRRRAGRPAVRGVTSAG